MSTTNILDLNNRIDELSASYPADKVMMSDGVTSVEDALDGLTDNSLGAGIDITSYTNTKYETTTDGYLDLVATSSTSTQIKASLYGADESTGFSITVTYNQTNSFNAIFVKKGMKIKIDLNNNNGKAYFYPLS